MQVKLVAKKDFETMDMWQQPLFINKDETHIGLVNKTDTGLELVTLNFNNVATVFDIRVIEKFFDIEYLKEN